MSLSRLQMVPWFLLASALAAGQDLQQRTLAHFTVTAEPRLTALARLGAATNTTILVEAGAMPYLQIPVSVDAYSSNVAAIADRILKGDDSYDIGARGALLLIAARDTHNRLLTLPLGPITFRGGALSGIIPLLGYMVAEATGCSPGGYGWAGPSMDANISPFHLDDATAEQVIEDVAAAGQPSMWVIAPEPSATGCVANPGAGWEVGLYGFGRLFASCATPFSSSAGPQYVPMAASPKGDETCKEIHLPANSPPLGLPARHLCSCVRTELPQRRCDKLANRAGAANASSPPPFS